MTRPNRIFVEGGVYHVYNRLGRGERVFDQETEAAAFVRDLNKLDRALAGWGRGLKMEFNSGIT